MAATLCLVASTLAQYPAYYGYNYNSLPYPYAYLYPIQRPATRIYLPPDVYRGYAYQTAYENGGGTKVVFVRGPGANAILEHPVRTFTYNPVLPVSVTATSNALEITPNNTKNTDEKDQRTKTSEQNNTTAPDAKMHAKIESKPINKETKGVTTTIASVILPPSHGTVTPYVATPGAFYYSHPTYVNSLAHVIQYFPQSLFNTPTDLFGRFGLPSLFSAFTENGEIYPNSSNIPLFDAPGFSESPASSDDQASSLPTDAPSGSSSDKDSSSSDEASTESNGPGGSPSSDTSSSSESNEASNSIESTPETAGSNTDANSSPSTETLNGSHEVTTKAANGSK